VSKYTFHISFFVLFNACKYQSLVDKKYKCACSSISFEFKKYFTGRVFGIYVLIYENNKKQRKRNGKEI
jgi:hypothetical protein